MIDYTDFWGKENYIDATIPREKWLDTEMTEKMKERFIDNYLSSRILYRFNNPNGELLVIEVSIKRPIRDDRNFTDIIHRAIPYDVLLIENYNDEWYKVSIVKAHISANNQNRKVVDRQKSSYWARGEELKSFLFDVKENLQRSRLQTFQQAQHIIEEFNDCLSLCRKTNNKEWQNAEKDFDQGVLRGYSIFTLLDCLNEEIRIILGEVEFEKELDENIEIINKIEAYVLEITSSIERFNYETSIYIGMDDYEGVDELEESYQYDDRNHYDYQLPIRAMINHLVADVNEGYELISDELNDIEWLQINSLLNHVEVLVKSFNMLLTVCDNDFR